MHHLRLSLAVLVVGLAVVQGSLRTASAAGDDADRPYGIEKRVLWTTSRIHGAPEPPSPYRTEMAFANLTFAEPLAMTAAPGSDRLYVVERYGKIYSFSNRPQTENAELFLDLGKMIYGLAFHPQFEKNGYCYITYVLDSSKELPKGTRVSRFRTTRDDPLRCDLRSELILLEWPSGGHNGGCLKFGPDGCLYIATGDSSGIADEYQTGQDLSTLPGSILRIDVDRREEGTNYAIPSDNPFVAVQHARPEIWAYGLRQPWKMSFDRATGDLWTGNVGQDLWEQIYRIERGGNYGWSVTEGSHPFRPERPMGPSPILQPIVEHRHTDFRSITGGFVYHGSRLKELSGAYIYGDYDTGRVWMLRHDGEKITEQRELLDSNLRLVGFAEDHHGELYLVDHMGGGIHRLVRNRMVEATSEFPRKLSETGLFTSVADHTPAAGLIPYSVIAPMWSDGAHKERLLALPGDSKIEYEAIEFPQPAPGAVAGWKFPDGTVIVETISLEMKSGQPASRRRLETRILHHERLTGTEEVGDQYWRGYTYLWNDTQTDATLLEDPSGLDRVYIISDDDAPGGKRRQTWHFPSRAECTVCHNMAAKYVLGINTLQLNKQHDYDGVGDNQLRTLEHLGVFSEPLPASPEDLPRLVNYSDETQDVGLRAQSYLHANCSHCHRKWGGGNAEFQLLATLGLPETGTLEVRPSQGTFSISHAEIIAPGAPERSVLFYRMAKLGSGRMPRTGSYVVDEQGLRLIHDWIRKLRVDGGSRGSSEPATQAGAKPESELRELLANRGKPSKTRAKEIDRMLASTNRAIRLMHAMDDDSVADVLRNDIIARATSHSAPHVRDLFERFLPEERRTKRLGSVVKPEEILALAGDVARGEQLFFEAPDVQCRNCHRVHNRGTEVGPDLSQIGTKYAPERLLESILAPSKVVEPKYVTYMIETTQGRVYTGLLVTRTTEQVVLKNAQNELIRLAPSEVEVLVPQRQSLMPDLLLRDMTAQQVADLVAYFGTLKSATEP